MSNRAIATWALIASLFVASEICAAEDVRALAETLVETKKNLVDNEAEKRKILGSLYTITKRMKKISQDKGHLTDELFHVQDNVQSIAKVIAGLETQIREQRVLLRARLRTLYKLSGEGYVGVLFSSANSLEFDQTLKFLKIVTDVDYRLIRSYQRNIAAYQQQRRKLKTQVEKLVGLERKIRAQEMLLTSEHKAKSEIVSGLERSHSHALKQLRRLRRKTENLDSKEADQTLLGLLKASFFEKKGQIPPPVLGPVVQDFGLIHDDRYMIQLSHKGWQYGVPSGTPVTSVFEGTVAHVGWIPGYGTTLIVDHGDHYYTVYSHLANPQVKDGDTVAKGQTIAEAGSTSGQHGDGIYFEIRHFSEPENPKHWIAAKDVPVSVKPRTEPIEVATARDLGAQ
ncbi:MAG: peptidoglycan DD-metalloendopeptidase family protein [Bdellovibrionaceae bacterium]|nr:peptidoglycan DD-metalloendopeptidase family protein [Pseudobdellovibrionaceae bacterium]